MLIRVIKSLSLILLLCNVLHATSTEELLKNSHIYKPPTYYEPSDELAYLGLSVGIMLTGAVLAAGILYLMPESVTNWNRDERGDIFKKWKTKTAQGPVVDNDEMWLNYIAHPYFGAVYYLQPRMAGYSWSASVLFSFVASNLFWEYGIEAFAEVPSWQDVIITPAIGSIIGEGFYRLIRYIQMNDNELFGQWWLGKLLIWLMDPLGSLIYSTGLGELLGIYNKNDMKSGGVEMLSTPLVVQSHGRVSLGVIVRF